MRTENRNAYIDDPLALWDVWTPVSGAPLAFEAPSAGFLFDWRFIAQLRERDIAFATITHAAGISSTGDPELDLRLPSDEPYFIPAGTVSAIRGARARSGLVVAIGTTVERAHRVVYAGRPASSSEVPQPPSGLVSATVA